MYVKKLKCFVHDARSTNCFIALPSECRLTMHASTVCHWYGPLLLWLCCLWLLLLPFLLVPCCCMMWNYFLFNFNILRIKVQVQSANPYNRGKELCACDYCCRMRAFYTTSTHVAKRVTYIWWMTDVSVCCCDGRLHEIYRNFILALIRSTEHKQARIPLQINRRWWGQGTPNGNSWNKRMKADG